MSLFDKDVAIHESMALRETASYVLVVETLHVLRNALRLELFLL